MNAHRATLVLVVIGGLAALACEPGGPSSEAPSSYGAPLRSDAELATRLAGMCQEAQAEGQPMLVEFSAAWCSDCRKLHAMKQDAPLSDELERWSTLVVNVGRFDRHRPLLDALGVESIAHWEVLAPTRCDTPIADWPSLARRTLEVSSGEARDLTPDDLARWLAGLRTNGSG